MNQGVIKTRSLDDNIAQPCATYTSLFLQFLHSTLIISKHIHGTITLTSDEFSRID